jgi:L-iditol 2-dehydrogenase
MIENTMKAAVLTSLKNVSVEEIEVPAPKENEVLIKLRAVGLCGSDIHYYEHGKIGNYVVEKPIILGHEAAGEIVEIGKSVTNFKVGQRVTIEPGATCGVCEYCQSNRYNLCPDVEFLATPPYDGAFCEYVAMRADLVFPIPDNMSYETAALVEPFSVGLHAIRRGGLEPNETVLITGMGPIGLLTAAAAKMAGAKTIIGVDLEQNRLDVAKRMGVIYTINLQKDSLEEKVQEYTGGTGVDLAIDASGSPKAVAGGIASVRRGGRVTVVGLSSGDEVPVNMNDIVDNEIDIRGVFRYHNTYPTAIEILSNGEIDIEQIITDKYSLDETSQAFKKAVTDKRNTLKVMVYPE